MLLVVAVVAAVVLVSRVCDSSPCESHTLADFEALGSYFMASRKKRILVQCSASALVNAFTSGSTPVSQPSCNPHPPSPWSQALPRSSHPRLSSGAGLGCPV